MTPTPIDADLAGPVIEVHLLGQVEFQRCLSLQQAVIEEVHGRPDGRISVLVCEHPPAITVGRGGSAGDVRREAGLIRHGQVPVHWVKRGGGTIVHAPGQVAIYPIVPLRWHGFSVGEYVDLLETALLRTARALGFPAERRAGQPGVWGRTGQLAQLGVAVRDWVAYHGAFLNVCPPMGLFELLEFQDDPARRVSSLAAEHGRRVRVSAVRAEVVAQLAHTLGCARYHLQSGHRLLRKE